MACEWDAKWWRAIALQYRDLFNKASEDCADLEDENDRLRRKSRPTLTITAAPGTAYPAMQQHYQGFAADEMED